MRKRIQAPAIMLLGWLATQAACGQDDLADAFNSPYYSRPTVSPYLNLAGRNQFGIANYHTLVRPMLDQQERARGQRHAPIKNPPLNNRSAGLPAGRRAIGVRTAASADRYMNYSHFYGGSITR
jgi:hypothetical protein